MGGQEGRVKRTQVRDADGWTVIAHSKGSRGPGSSSRSKNHAELKDAARPRDTVEGLTVSKLLDSFREHEARWRDSQCAKHLEGVLKTRMGDGVQEAVCVGVGSFSLDWEHRHRSMWQLVLFMAVVGLGACSLHQPPLPPPPHSPSTPKTRSSPPSTPPSSPRCTSPSSPPPSPRTSRPPHSSSRRSSSGASCYPSSCKTGIPRCTSATRSSTTTARTRQPRSETALCLTAARSWGKDF
ncbi:hypothetical protein BDV95DRAFT_178585 [Massariosphaeria phaeospora]|uniref:SRR1-like domain-containing protein n=1 Tax=Massariosphaeria phaeospora TaxID=100035 RepID=A0A7C8M9F5_9PLEO|nr:hypothetical protein BDV95DRAFT_178585 [Massariosphaeria phaeospora]